MSNKALFKQTDLVCLSCGNVTSIMRRESKMKSLGHIKDLWCYRCEDVTKHYEVKDISKFMFEYNTRNLEEKMVADLVISGRENCGKKR